MYLITFYPDQVPVPLNMSITFCMAQMFIILTCNVLSISIPKDGYFFIVILSFPKANKDILGCLCNREVDHCTMEYIW